MIFVAHQLGHTVGTEVDPLVLNTVAYKSAIDLGIHYLWLMTIGWWHG